MHKGPALHLWALNDLPSDKRVRALNWVQSVVFLNANGRGATLPTNSADGNKAKDKLGIQMVKAHQLGSRSPAKCFLHFEVLFQTSERLK